MPNSVRYTVGLLLAFFAGMSILLFYGVLPQYAFGYKPNTEWRDDSPNICKPEKTNGKCYFQFQIGDAARATVLFVSKIGDNYVKYESSHPYLARLASEGKPVIEIIAHDSAIPIGDNERVALILLEDQIRKYFLLDSPILRQILVIRALGGSETEVIFIPVPDLSPTGFQELRTYLETGVSGDKVVK